MDLTYPSRGVDVDDQLRRTATHKLSKLERLEPRTTRIDLEFISEHHRSPTARSASRLHSGCRGRRSALRARRRIFRRRSIA